MLFLVFYQLNNEKPPYQKQYDESYPLFDKGKSAEVDFYNLLVSLGVNKIAMNVVLEDDVISKVLPNTNISQSFSYFVFKIFSLRFFFICLN